MLSISVLFDTFVIRCVAGAQLALTSLFRLAFHPTIITTSITTIHMHH